MKKITGDSKSNTNVRRDTWMNIRERRTSDVTTTASGTGVTAFEVVSRKGKVLMLADGTSCTEFISCSYLGLESHPELVGAAQSALERIGVHLSASRSAMSPSYLRELEQLLSDIYGGCSITVFTSTSNVHLGVLPLLGSGRMEGYPTKRAVKWLVDRTAHASMQILRGVMSQFGDVDRVDTRDLTGLKTALATCVRDHITPVLLIDGVGSMSGLLPVNELSDLLATAGGYLYVDDAHGISITGRHGAGYAFEALGYCLRPNTLIAGSLSKAFGGAGGFIVLNADYNSAQLRALANPLVFGHTVSVPLLAANVASARLHLSSDIVELQNALWANVRRFDGQIEHKLMNASLPAPIRGALFHTEKQGVTAASNLRDAGLVVFPVFYPIVETGKAMLRFAFSSLHTPSQIDALAHQITSQLYHAEL